LECKRTWQSDEEAELKIYLFGGEPPVPPTQSDEVVLLDSQLPEVDEVVATLDEANTQKSKRRKRATQDESSLKKRARKLKTVEDDPPPPVSPEATVAFPATLSPMSRPPPPPVLSSAKRPSIVSECILNASILHQRRHFKEVSDFILFLPPSHTRRALGVTRVDVGMADPVIVDIPENLPVPNISDPTYSVPSWNVLDPDFLDELFDFADEIVHDDGALFFFHPDDNGDFKESIQDHFAAFEFTIFKE
jgi:hypothetical protein